jgi:hypothetical protein
MYSKKAIKKDKEIEMWKKKSTIIKKIISKIINKNIGKDRTAVAYWVIDPEIKNIIIKVGNKINMDITTITLMIWWWACLNFKKKETFLIWMASMAINTKRKMIMASIEKVHSWICFMIASKITIWMPKWNNSHLLLWMIKTNIF